jgi:tetrapyrrole methylase family protein/MazG family protein
MIIFKGVMKKYLKEFDKLVGIFSTLRSKNGCAWDKEQTHETLVKYLFCEAKEVKQALENKDKENLEEELGDILMQVVFHAQIAKENKDFDITGVIEKLNKKLVRRHPHIFGNHKVKDAKDIEVMWKKIKEKENKRHKSVLK